MRLLPLLFAVLILATGATAAQVQLKSFPQTGQLYARNAHNFARVEVVGAVTESGWDELELRVGTRTAVIDRQIVALRYVGGEARFALSTRLLAGLRDYGFELRLRRPGASLSVARAQSVVCGDVFLIAGQSNAAAPDYWNEKLANLEQSWWVRSFGSSTLRAKAAREDLRWYRAEGERQRAKAAVGAWGLALGAQLVREGGVPVAILNGAVGGTPISFHLRNEQAPLDLTTAYGRLLWRVGNAGLHEQVRAIFWNQGESDGALPVLYENRFGKLIDAWRENYPALQKVYVVQTRRGCGVDENSKLFEIQRGLALLYPEVQLMSATALPAHDGCHYRYAGYEQLAHHLARQVARDFFGRPYGPAIDPPNALAAEFVGGVRDRVRVEFDLAGGGLVAQPGCETSFFLDDGAQVMSASTQGRFLELQLDRPTNSAELRFVGQIGGTTGFVVNRLGVGALAFAIPLQ